ncbi:MAG: (4Fe-4S)-binding protein [Xanthomonadaceae bacterium]|nr:(4Fe-4S)-binding protein [Rhodospirillaceae bacterium]NIA17568.1 (4Fe-4S)-binding protein [Xanthomonadaceae bacterium]
MFKINKQECRGCGACINNCPGGIQIGSDGKAEIIDQEKLAKCGGKEVCPFGVIFEEGSGDKDISAENSSSEPQSVGNMGMGNGEGRGRGRGRGMGRGPRDGRGKGRGRGNR